MTPVPAPRPNLQALSANEFGALAEPHRRELQAHGYRMLGSLQEAEDVVQETFLRAWRGREGYEGRASLRTWLYKIATNLCLDRHKQRARRARRTLPVAHRAASAFEDPIPPAVRDPFWLEPCPDDLIAPEDVNPEARYTARESVTLAFMTALHVLPPRQRAVLLLRDVLDWPASDVAGLLEMSVPGVKSALHRARASLTSRYTAGQNAEAASPLDGARRDLLQRYVRAWETADVEGLLQLLKDEATFSMPPLPVWYQGRETVGGLVRKTVFSGEAAGRWRLRPTRANNRPAFGLYRVNDQTGQHEFYGITVVSLQDGAIADLTTFINPAYGKYFGMPPLWEDGI